MIVLRQSPGTAGFGFIGLLTFSLMAACFAVGHAGAQTTPQPLTPQPLPETPPPGDTYTPPERRGYEVKQENRKYIICSARREAYEQRRCDQACTDACKDIGTALQDCDLPKTASCAR
jgi:hypothetical protein